MKLSSILILAATFSNGSLAEEDHCCLCDECRPVEYDLTDKALIDGSTGAITTCDVLMLSLLEESKRGDHQCEAAQMLFRQPCCTPHDDQLEYVDRERLARRSLWKFVNSSFGSAPYRSFSSQNSAAFPTSNPFRKPATASFYKPQPPSKSSSFPQKPSFPKKTQPYFLFQSKPKTPTFSSPSFAKPQPSSSFPKAQPAFSFPKPQQTSIFRNSNQSNASAAAVGGMSASARGCDRICPPHQMKYYCRGVHLNPFAAQKDLPIINTNCENVHKQLARANGAVCDMAAATIPATCGCPGAQNNFAQFFGAVNTKSCGASEWFAN